MQWHREFIHRLHPAFVSANLLTLSIPLGRNEKIGPPVKKV